MRDSKFTDAKEGFNNYGIDQFWVAFNAYASFLTEICGLELRPEINEKFEVNQALVKSCGWTWWHKNILVISDRPLFINRDEQGRLHSETRASIAYRDGWSLYHWHGVKIPKEWITDRTNLTAKTALTWSNIEQRRAASELVGWDKILNELTARTIDHDPDPEHGTLYEVDLPDSPKEKFLRVKCATGRTFALRIDPKAKTVLEAQCWLKYRHFDTSKFNYPEITA